MTAPRVVVVGAGLAGLAAAEGLVHASPPGPAPSVVVVEAASRAGGAVWTEHTLHGRYEWGPEGWFQTPEMNLVIDRLGLPTIAATSTGGATRLALRGRLRPLPLHLASGAVPPPSSVVGLIRHGVLSPAAALRMTAEPLVALGARPAASLGEDYRRRLGAQATRRLVAPFAEGVLGSPPERLAATVVPRPVGRSLVLASLRRGPARAARARLVAPEAGMSSLVQRLAADVDLLLGTAARALVRHGRRLTVVTEAGDLAADAVVLAVPPPVAAGLVAGLATDASAALAGIATTTSAVVQVDLPADQAAVLQSFDSGGWLGAPEERPAVSAGSFAGLKWPQLGAPTRLRLVVRRPDLVSGDDHALGNAALAEAGRLLGVTPLAGSIRIHRWADALPVRAPDTAARVAAARAELPPSVRLIGTAAAGVGVSTAVAAGCQAATEVRHLLG